MVMRKPTRRQFLQTATRFAAGAIAVPAFIPAAARGGPGRVAPSDRLVLGLIGMGKMCYGHLGDLLNRQNVQIAALCDVESTRLEKCRKRVEDSYAARSGKSAYKGCDTYRDFRELLARPDIDAVLIATPTNWHAVMAVAACRAGKDVYCEKPLSLTIREGQAVAAAARRYGTVFQTGSQQRSDYNFRFACELVRNGRIGRVKEIFVNVGGPPGPCYLPAETTPKTLDWDMWLGPAPYRPYNHDICPLDDYKTWPRWRAYRDFGGGGMTDWGAHHFDIVQWALGMDDSGPVEIVPPDGREVKRLTFRYADGTRVHHGGGGNGAGVDFIGTEGRIIVNRGFLKVEPESLRRTRWGPDDVRLYQSKNHKANWFECIRTRRPTICTAAIGYRSVSVCHLGNIAYRLKRPLRWDPAAVCFLDDEPANRLVGRPMRAPWLI